MIRKQTPFCFPGIEPSYENSSHMRIALLEDEPLQAKQGVHWPAEAGMDYFIFSAGSAFRTFKGVAMNLTDREQEPALYMLRNHRRLLTR